jgi:hypothetical protein
MTSATRTPTVPAPASVPPARLHLRPATRDQGGLDGGWWPRSGDPTTEIPGLITALGDRHGALTRVILNSHGWHPTPRRLSVSGSTIRLDWFTSLDAHLLIVVSADGERTDLLVVPPETTAPRAATALTIAADRSNTLQPAAILTEAASPPPPPGPPERLAEAAWETDGGRVPA